MEESQKSNMYFKAILFIQTQTLRISTIVWKVCVCLCVCVCANYGVRGTGIKAHCINYE